MPEGKINTILHKTSGAVFVLGFILCSTVVSFNMATRDWTLPTRNLIWGITTLALFLLVVVRKDTDWSILKNPIFGIFAFLCIVTGYSICVSTNSGEVIYSFLRSIMMLAYLFMACLYLKDHKNIGKWIILITIASGAYCIFCKNLGYQGEFLRGLMANKNQSSSAFLLLMILCIHYWKQWKIPATIAIAVSLFMIFTLRARSSWVALFVAGIVFIVTYRKYALYAAVGLVLACGITYGVKGNSIFNMDSMRQRFDLWRVSCHMVKDNPIGVGAGNWKIIYPSYSAYLTPATRSMTYKRTFFARLHNDPFQQLVELGVAGFIAYMLIFILAVWYSRGMVRIGIVSYFVVSLFTFPGERSFHSMMLMIYIAHAIMQRHKTTNYRLKWKLASCIVMTLMLLMAVFDFAVRFDASRVAMSCLKAQAVNDWDRVISETENIWILSTIDISATPLSHYRGVAFHFKKDMPMALECFERAVADNPNHLFVRISLASYYTKFGQHKKAIKICQKTIEMFPDYGPAHKCMQNAIHGLQVARNISRNAVGKSL